VCFEGAAYRSVQRGLVGDVAVEGHPAQFLSQGVEPVRLEADQRHASAPVHGAAGRGLADATGGARDQHHSARHRAPPAGPSEQSVPWSTRPSKVSPVERHPMAATRTAADLRRDLADGLAAAITDKGYAATTIADIVARARVSKRTFYEHFADKEACLLA